MGVESVTVAGALTHADTLEISCHSPTRVLLPALESMDSKRHTSYRSYSTNVHIQNHWSTALKLLGKTAQTPLCSLQRHHECHIIIYIQKITQHMMPNTEGMIGQKIKIRKQPKRWNTVCYSVSNKQKHSITLSRNCNRASVLKLIAQISERHWKCENWKIQIWTLQISEAHSWWAKNAQLCHLIRKQQHPRPAQSSEGSRNLPKRWSPQLGHGAVLAASKPLQVSK